MACSCGASGGSSRCSCNSGTSLPIGPQGSQGPQGIQGPIGPQGIQGPQGDVGPTGPAGPAGANGASGTNGTNGTDGDDGIAFQIIPLYGTTTRFCEVTGLSGTYATQFIYPGAATHRTPSRIKIVTYGQTGVTEGRIDIHDDTNFVDWVNNATFVPGTSSVIIDLGAPVNISAGEALITLEITGNTVGETITVVSLMIDYS